MKRILAAGTAIVLSGFLVLGLAVGPRASATVPGVNTRVSLSGSGAQSSSDSPASQLSRDGRYVAFTNLENNFVGSDTNNARDVFVRDITNNTTTRVSISTSGVGANSGTGGYMAISETGRYVVFSSTSSNLIDSRTITSSYQQLYVRDTVSNTTTILSEVSAGTFANSDITPLNVSTDGRFVLFRSPATNLGPTITNGTHSNIFLLDRSTGAITWVNAQASGAPNYGNETYDAEMSCDGSFIVFDSGASYLGLPPASAGISVFLLDRRGGNTLTNITPSANGAALDAKISCNGNYIGFTSYATNLDSAMAGMASDYHGYLYDRINDEFKLVDQDSSGNVGNVDIIYLSTDPLYLSIADTGQVAFGTHATNLDPAGTTSFEKMFVRDPWAGTTELLTRDSGGTEANNDSMDVSISLDGSLAAYGSSATNLISGDTNSRKDIFVSQTGF